MAIQDDFELNNKINGGGGSSSSINLNGELDTTKKKYCKKCGRRLVYAKTDPQGEPNRNQDNEWRLCLCHNCYVMLVQDHRLHDYIKKVTED